jgi:hypothetical protein
LIEKNNGAVFQTSDFDELMQECLSLLTEKHHYKTLIIDPLTTVYNDLLDKASLLVGTDFGRHYGEANKRMQKLLNILLRLDMNVIITSHAKNEYGQKMEVLGQTFDCYKKLDYLFDLVIEIKKQGKDRVGYIKKSRMNEFPCDESFVFSYDAFAKKYGKEVLEKDAVPEQLATKEQVTEAKRLIELLKLPENTLEKWLNKVGANSLEETNSDSIKKIIDYLNSKVTNNQPEEIL